MPLVLPHRIRASSLIDATEHQENYDAIAAKFGNIVDADIDDNAGVRGTKLYAGTDNGRKVQTASIADGAITGGTAAGGKIAAGTVRRENMVANAIGFAELASSASIDSDRAVGSDHIRDRQVGKGKITAASLTFQEMNKLEVSVIMDGTAASLAAGTAGVYSLAVLNPATGVAVSPATARLGTHEFLSVRLEATGVPAAGSFAAMMIHKVYADTATGFYHLIIANPMATTQSPGNRTYFIVFLRKT